MGNSTETQPSHCLGLAGSRPGDAQAPGPLGAAQRTTATAPHHVRGSPMRSCSQHPPDRIPTGLCAAACALSHLPRAPLSRSALTRDDCGVPGPTPVTLLTHYPRGQSHLRPQVLPNPACPPQTCGFHVPPPKPFLS